MQRPDLEDLHGGIVVQAYLRDSARDLESLAEWAKGRRIPPGVRLVKGSYWDTETVEADAQGWNAPVFERKAETDANFERLVSILHSHHGTLRAAFGSHNLRSLAVAITRRARMGIPDNGYEIQLLFGMAEPVHDAMRRLGARVTRVRPHGRAGPRHGLPGAQAAREHLERELRAAPFRRGGSTRRAARSAGCHRAARTSGPRHESRHQPGSPVCRTGPNRSLSGAGRR